MAPGDRRLGRIRLDAELLEDFPRLVRVALAGVLILDCWYDHMGDCYWYTGTSEWFEPLCKGDVIPIYQAVFDHGRVAFRI